VKKKEESDFDLTISVCKNICEKYGKFGPASCYPEKERPVVMTTTVTGLIENGGFRYLFGSTLPGDLDYKHTLESFKKIGCQPAVEIIEEVLSHFPGKKPPIDDVKRVNAYESIPEEIRDSLDSRFWKIRHDITECLANYIRKEVLPPKK